MPSVEGLETRQLLNGSVGVDPKLPVKLPVPPAVMTPAVQGSISLNFHKTVNISAATTLHIINILNKASSETKDKVIKEVVDDLFHLEWRKAIVVVVEGVVAEVGLKRIAGWFQAALNKSHGRGTTLDVGVSHFKPFLHVNPR